MKFSLFSILLLGYALIGCDDATLNNNAKAEEPSNAPLLEAAIEKPSENSHSDNAYIDSDSGPSKIALAECKSVYDNNLNPVDYITITNNTNRSIKGIEVFPIEGDERIKYKISLAPHSSKKVKNAGFSCSSTVAGIFYSNGEYQERISLRSGGIDTRKY